VNLAVEVEPSPGAGRTVEYRWDPDTDILSAQLHPSLGDRGMSGSVELEGADGSWLILDVTDGRINGVEVAVWPEVQKFAALSPPSEIEDAAVRVPSRNSQPVVASLEVETPLMAEADLKEQTFHFRLGGGRRARTVRLGRDLLVDLDNQSHIVGLWLLNVPPFPVATE
jgi:hypothetical protein